MMTLQTQAIVLTWDLCCYYYSVAPVDPFFRLWMSCMVRLWLI